LNRNPREVLIFALDVGEGIKEAISWVERLKDTVEIFKVGKESFTRYGPRIIDSIREKGKKVFLDLKFHDIPHTVAGAVVGAVELGVYMFNVHALGGRKMMEETVTAAYSAVKLGRQKPIILAVTVLTSLNDNDLMQLGFGCRADELAVRLAKIAQESGISGVVSSVHDIDNIRSACGQDFIIVSPGIRESDVADDDQKRTSTVRNAIMRGADYIVVGRPISKAKDPVCKAEEIVCEITQVLAMREKVV